PRNDGGNPVKGYIIERREKGGKRKEWSKINRGDLHKVSKLLFLILLEAHRKTSRKKLVYKTH
ncbi:unnamed protein product, partial [Rotaria magnacalcarata]